MNGVAEEFGLKQSNKITNYFEYDQNISRPNHLGVIVNRSNR